MDGTKTLMVAATGFALLVITAVIASPLVSNTPLYTVRMEQESSKMNFLPTEVSAFTYTAERGYELTYDVHLQHSEGVYATLSGPTCYITCEPTCAYWTCPYSSCKKPCW